MVPFQNKKLLCTNFIANHSWTNFAMNAHEASWSSGYCWHRLTRWQIWRAMRVWDLRGLSEQLFEVPMKCYQVRVFKVILMVVHGLRPSFNLKQCIKLNVLLKLSKAESSSDRVWGKAWNSGSDGLSERRMSSANCRRDLRWDCCWLTGFYKCASWSVSVIGWFSEASG